MKSSKTPITSTLPGDDSRLLQFGKVVGLCTLASVCYGLVHDTFTMLVCKPYFTEHHPDVFHTDNTLLLILGWGVYATWWMGAGLGTVIGLAATVGRGLPLPARRLVRPVVVSLAAVLGVAFSVWMFVMFVVPAMIGPAKQPKPEDVRLMASALMHVASYQLSALVGLGLAGRVLLLRRRMQRPTG